MRQERVIVTVQQRVKMDVLEHVVLLGGRFEVAAGSPTAQARVVLDAHSQYLVSEWDGGPPTTTLVWFRNVDEELVQDLQEEVFLSRLGLVVCCPVLRVGFLRFRRLFRGFWRCIWFNFSENCLCAFFHFQSL